MKKKLFMSGMLAVALMGSAFSANHTAHASTLKPHQGTTTFATIDSKVHLDSVTVATTIVGIPVIATGEGLLVGVHYECPLNPLTALPQPGTISVTATQTGSGDGAPIITSTGTETIICDSTEHEVVVAIPPAVNPATGAIVGDFNDGPVSLVAAGLVGGVQVFSATSTSHADEH